MPRSRKILLCSLAAFLTVVILLTTLLVLGVFSVDMGKTVLSYKGERVSTAELTYWTSTLKTHYLSGAPKGSRDTEAFWASMANQTQTHKQAFDALLLAKLKQVLVSKYLFDQWELTYPAGTDVDGALEEKKRYYREYDEMDEWEQALSRLGVSERQLRQIYLAEAKVAAVKSHLLTTLTAQSQEYAAALQNHFTEHYLNVQFAVFYLSYNPETKEEITSPTEQQIKRNRAEEMLAQGRAQTKTAVELISEYSEYDTLTGYTNGWFLSEQDNFDANLYAEFAKTEVGAWGSYEFTENGDTYLYVWHRNAISDYDLMGTDEKSTLAARAKDAYYTAQMEVFGASVTVDRDVLEQYSVVTTLPSKNTNL